MVLMLFMVLYSDPKWGCDVVVTSLKGWFQFTLQFSYVSHIKKMENWLCGLRELLWVMYAHKRSSGAALTCPTSPKVLKTSYHLFFDY